MRPHGRLSLERLIRQRCLSGIKADQLTAHTRPMGAKYETCAFVIAALALSIWTAKNDLANDLVLGSFVDDLILT